MTSLSAIAVAVCLSGAPAALQETEAKAENSVDKVVADQEAKFEKTMSGATLVGRFTIDGMKDGEIPKPERYEIDSVRKLRDDIWVFTARIKYGKHDIKVPMQLKVKWAGDTPVINMDNFTIPAMGTFSFRVLFHGDRYVGSWQHGKVGGHMFGRIEPKQTDGESPTTGE